jgi:chromosome segregation ATPase
MDSGTVAIILAGLSLLGTIVAEIFNFRNKKATAKKIVAEAEKIAEETQTMKDQLSENSLKAANQSITAQIEQQEQINILRGFITSQSERISIIESDKAALKNEVIQLKETTQKQEGRIIQIEREKEGLRVRMGILEMGVSQLSRQLVDLGHIPVWTFPQDNMKT